MRLAPYCHVLVERRCNSIYKTLHSTHWDAFLCSSSPFQSNINMPYQMRVPLLSHSSGCEVPQPHLQFPKVGKSKSAKPKLEACDASHISHTAVECFGVGKYQYTIQSPTLECLGMEGMVSPLCHAKRCGSEAMQLSRKHCTHVYWFVLVQSYKQGVACICRRARSLRGKSGDLNFCVRSAEELLMHAQTA